MGTLLEPAKQIVKKFVLWFVPEGAELVLAFELAILVLILGFYLYRKIHGYCLKKRNKILHRWLRDASIETPLSERLQNFRQGTLFDKEGFFQVNEALRWFSKDLVTETWRQILEEKVRWMKINRLPFSIDIYSSEVAERLIRQLTSPSEAKRFVEKAHPTRKGPIYNRLIRHLILEVGAEEKKEAEAITRKKAQQDRLVCLGAWESFWSRLRFRF